jgi:hypothetical protein
MADKKITPKAAASKDKQSGDRAAARVSLKKTNRKMHKKTAKKLSAKKN